MKKEIFYIIGGFLLILLLLKKPIQNMTRGYRNNNFGNIRLTFDKNGKKTFWTGEINGSDKSFKTFENPAFGYRAIFVLLRGYMKKGRNTIEEIIKAYAPSNENNTLAYIEAVSKSTNLQPDEAISENDFIKIVKAISKVENGLPPNEDHIKKGYELFKNV